MKQLINYYADYDEDARLVKDNAHQVEFLTTIQAVTPRLKKKSRVLEVGAGTGRYALHLANLGHNVVALDVVPKHVEALQQKSRQSIKKGGKLAAHLGDARNLAAFDDKSFDLVLCLGPLYHLPLAKERRACLAECSRVLKKNGLLAAAYINRFAAIIANPPMLKSNKTIDRWLRDGYDQGPFYLSTPTEADRELRAAGLRQLDHVGSDGISYARTGDLVPIAVVTTARAFIHPRGAVLGAVVESARLANTRLALRL